MSTPTTSNNIGVDTSSQPELATLTQTSDDRAVSKLGQPISPSAPSSDSINGGLSVGSQVTVGAFKQAGAKTIEGSYAGDSRSSGDSAKSAMDKVSNSPAPRERVGQFPLGKNSPDGPAPVSAFADADDVIGG